MSKKNEVTVPMIYERRKISVELTADELYRIIGSLFLMADQLTRDKHSGSTSCYKPRIAEYEDLAKRMDFEWFKLNEETESELSLAK